MTLLIVVVALLVLFFANVILLIRLRVHRTDITNSRSMFEGTSAIWQKNVLAVSNYDELGRKLVRWYYVVLMLQGLCIIIALYFFIR